MTIPKANWLVLTSSCMRPKKVLHQERRELSSARIAGLIGFQKISLKIFSQILIV